MVVKVLTALVVLAAIAWMLRPRRPTVAREPEAPPPRVPLAHDLEKCDRCGIWLPAGQHCECQGR